MVWVLYGFVQVEKAFLYFCQLYVLSDSRPVSQYNQVKQKAKKKRGWGRTNTSENRKTFGFKSQRKLLPKLPLSSIVLAYDHMSVWKWLITTKRINIVYRKDSVVIGKNFLSKRIISLDKTEQNRWSVTNAGLFWLWKKLVIIILVSLWHFLTLQIQATWFPSFFQSLFSLCLVIESNSVVK